jgi:hypothetical protein
MRGSNSAVSFDLVLFFEGFDLLDLRKRRRARDSHTRGVRAKHLRLCWRLVIALVSFYVGSTTRAAPSL